MKKIKNSTNLKIFYIPILILGLLLLFGTSLFLKSLQSSLPALQQTTIITNSVLSSPNAQVEVNIGGTDYPLVFNAKLGNNILDVEAGFNIQLSGTTIISASQTGIDSYRFSHFEIYKDGNYYMLPGGLTLDASYITPQANISVLGVYVSISKLTLNIPRDYQSMGNALVYLKDDATETLTRVYAEDSETFVFDTGTIIIIEAVANPFHKFKEFKQNYKSELIETEPSRLEIKLLTNREITLYFEKIIYAIQTTIDPSSADMVTLSTNSMQLGDDVFVSVDLNSFYKIKDFKINGLSINRDSYSGDVTFSGNVATIKVTKDWLQGYSNILDIKIITELNETFIIIIICASIAIPFFLMLLFTLIAIGKKQRKILHSQIQSKRTHDQRMNTGDFVRGLQDGSIGSISDKTLQDKIDKMNQYEE